MVRPLTTHTRPLTSRNLIFLQRTPTISLHATIARVAQEGGEHAPVAHSHWSVSSRPRETQKSWPDVKMAPHKVLWRVQVDEAQHRPPPGVCAAAVAHHCDWRPCPKAQTLPLGAHRCDAARFMPVHSTPHLTGPLKIGAQGAAVRWGRNIGQRIAFGSTGFMRGLQHTAGRIVSRRSG